MPGEYIFQKQSRSIFSDVQKLDEFITSRPKLEGNVNGSPSNRKKENDAIGKSGSPQGIKSTRNVNYMLTKYKDI